MSNPLLTTKLYMPTRRPNLVRRPRLIERLDAGIVRKLTLVCAPAGFGKTTLVSEWILAGTRPSFWLSLDEGDNDPTRFLAYLVTALQTIKPRLGEGVMDIIQSPQPPPFELIMTILLNEINEVADPFTIVLDDYHLLNVESIDRALAFLIEGLPTQMHLVIASRTNPRRPLARLRARDQLTELGATDLRFTSSEAADFLNQIMGLDLAAEGVAALESRTEGWIAGLQLAALSMQGHENATEFIAAFTGSHRFVMDYLVEEVLQRQPERIQAFLLQTSILDRMCGPLCDAVIGAPDAHGQTTLEALEAANLFIVPLDDQRRWFRYHHLFADLLRQQLQRRATDRSANGGPDESRLHLRASDWHQAQGRLADALRHALAAGDAARAADLAELAWLEMDQQLRSTAWLEWVEALPADLIRTRPVLCLAHAWALINIGEVAAGETWLDDAEGWLDLGKTVADPGTAPGEMVVVDQAQFATLPAGIAAARAYGANVRGDVSGTMAHARRALGHLPEDDHLRRGSLTALLGCSYWASGDLVTAHRTLMAGMTGMHKGGNVPWAISVTIGLARIKQEQGRLHKAIADYEQALCLAADQGMPGIPVMAYMNAELTMVRIEQGDLDAAARHLRQSETLGEKAAFPEWRYRHCLAQARLMEVQGDWDGALEMLDEAQRRYCRTPLPDLRPVAALKIRIWIKQGQLTPALDWAQDQGLSVDDELSYLHEFEHLTLSRLRLPAYEKTRSNRSIHAALGLLTRLLKAAQDGQRMGCALEILVVQALAHQSTGDIPMALAAHGTRLDPGRTGGLRSHFRGRRTTDGTPAVRGCREWIHASLYG